MGNVNTMVVHQLMSSPTSPSTSLPLPHQLPPPLIHTLPYTLLHLLFIPLFSPTPDFPLHPLPYMASPSTIKYAMCLFTIFCHTFIYSSPFPFTVLFFSATSFSSRVKIYPLQCLYVAEMHPCVHFLCNCLGLHNVSSQKLNGMQYLFVYLHQTPSSVSHQM